MGIIEVNADFDAVGISSRQITVGEEYSMVREFIDFRKNSFKSSAKKQLVVFVEMKVNNAYPDIVLAEYDPSCFDMWNSARNKLVTLDLKVLHFIFTQKNVTSQTIIRQLSISYKALVLSLEALIDAKLIERRGGYWTILNKSKVLGTKRIEAVEAKISKFDTVLQQAIINTSFASESFVLSKRMRPPNDSIAQRLDHLGIGLYIYNSKEFSCFAKSNHKRLPSNYNSLYINECIGKILCA